MKRSLLSRSVRAVCSTHPSAAAAITSPAYANDSETLDTVVVEGDRISVIPTAPLESVFGFGKSAVETPRSVTTISAEMLNKVMITEIDDLVALTPGSFTQSFFGVASSLDVRGTPGENYFRGIKRIDNPGNYPTPIGASDRIDVVRGPASPIYGPSKIGGYLNFVPKSARASSGSYLNEAEGELGVTSGSWDKKVIHAEVGGPGELFGKPMGYYLVHRVRELGQLLRQHHDRSKHLSGVVRSQRQRQRAPGVRRHVSRLSRQSGRGLEPTDAGSDRQRHLHHRQPGEPGHEWRRPVVGLASRRPAVSGTSSSAPRSPIRRTITADLIADHPNMALQNAGTAKLKGNQVLVQEDDTLEDEVLTMYFDYIYDSGGVMKVTNKTFFESLDNNNENIYGFSQFADTWVVEDQLIFTFDLPSSGPVKASFQVSPSIRHQDFEHGDNFAYEYFDRRDLTTPGSPIDRRTMATRGQELYSAHTVGKYTDYGLAVMADVTFFDKLNFIGGARYDYLDMESEVLMDSSTIRA